MNILGISSYYHDSAACLIINGDIKAAVQEERFTRIKHDYRFPKNSIKFCLKKANLKPEDLDFVVFYEKPFLKFERILETYLAFAPFGYKSFAKSMPLWAKDKLFQKKTIIKELENIFNNQVKFDNKILFSEHHLSHAASAFYPSPFSNAAILTMDGVGEWSTTSIALGNANNIKIIKEINFPHSLGLLYSAFTYYTGFKVNSGEYKLMGLAPYGEPKYVKKIKDNLVDIKDDGSFKLDISYFNYCTGLTMTSKKFDNLFGGIPRKPESKLTQREMNIAASIQNITEEIVFKIAKNIKKETEADNLCIAGGVALNCVSNGMLLKEKIFKNIWIQPASGDSGGALGAALAVHYIKNNSHRKTDTNKDKMKGTFLGPSFTDNEIEKTLLDFNAVFNKFDDANIINETCKALISGKAIGWMNGRMEFGPRSLGSRSILADPRSETMQKNLNLKVKYRESFRPFAPSIIIDEVSNWFELNCHSDYMLLVANVKKDKCKNKTEDQNIKFGIEKLNLIRSIIPAVTHVDYSARIHTVDKKINPKYYSLISKFYELTGCPLIVNTSFNIRGEPIVCSPYDAYKCFMGTELDILVINNYFLDKKLQSSTFKENYKNKYQLD